MELCLKEAATAFSLGEIPVGAVIVKGGEVIASAHNTRETERNALGHAEINAINEACKKLGSWRLSDCTLYVTLEPCPMCMGAIINSRIDTVVFGAYDLKAGCCDSICNFNSLGFNHKPEIYGGISEMKCNEILGRFFKNLREKNGEK